MERESQVIQDKGNKSTYSVPNLERALTVLELMMQKKKGMSLAEIQEATGFPKSSLFRIVQTLTDRGFLLKDGKLGTFTLSKKLLYLGMSTLSESSLVEICLPYMRQLRNELKETVLLGTLMENDGVLLEQVLGNHPFTFMLKPGKRFNLYASAPGKAILAYTTEDECTPIMNELSFDKFTPNTILNKEDYQKELVTVRQKGYAVDYAEELEGVHCIGAPIFDRHGAPIAAIWITAPSLRLPVEKFEEKGRILKEACLAISKQFGFMEMPN